MVKHSLGIDPILSPPVLTIFVVVFSIALFLYYRRYRSVVSNGYWWTLVGAKFLSLILLLILLLNPYLITESPDTNKFSIAVLIDATRSMDTADCGDTSRIEFIKNSILRSSSDFHQRLFGKYQNAKLLLFSGDDLRRIQHDTMFDTLPGDTDIDHALNTLLTNPIDQNALGAVILISDGRDNRGGGMMDAIRPYKTAGIPVHCIGVGNSKERKDFGVKWGKVRDEIPKSERIKLEATLVSNFPGAYVGKVLLYENTRLLEERLVEFDEGTLSQTIVFEHIGFTPGLKTYKIHVEPIAGEKNLLNNTDFVGVRVKDPDIFKVLFFNANLDWDYKYLQRFAENQEKLQLDAVIRLGVHRYFMTGIDAEDGNPEGFPDCETLSGYDCLIINVNSLYLLDSDDISCLVNFAENRGGGVIFTGVADEIPAEVLQCLPVTELSTQIINVQKSAFEFVPSHFLTSGLRKETRRLESKLYVPRHGELYKITESQVKPGASTVMRMRDSRWILLAMHHYGAGKVAFLNLPETWRWEMNIADGDYYYATFWGQLITWMSSSSKQKLTIKPGSTKLRLSEEIEFKVDVLNDNYIPDNDADARCVIALPDGSEEELNLIPDPNVDGRYLGKFIPKQTGEHRFHVDVDPEVGEKLEIIGDYFVVDLSPESEPLPMAEEELQSLARHTGGDYWNFADIDKIDEIKLTENVNTIEQRQYWLSNWWFLLVILAAVIPDWILRRRIGLK